jgi:hypothetical protein
MQVGFLFEALDEAREGRFERGIPKICQAGATLSASAKL